MDLGYAFIVVNFRGYRYSEGKISLTSQFSDGLKLLEFAEKMAEKRYFLRDDLNIIAHDLGAYIALLVCSTLSVINKLLLISPILNLPKLIKGLEFERTLYYINKFLPGNVKGIENPQEFIKMTRNELSKKEFQLEDRLSNLKVNDLKVIIGEKDDITPLSELEIIGKYLSSGLSMQKVIIGLMDHDPIEENELLTIKKEVLTFFNVK